MHKELCHRGRFRREGDTLVPANPTALRHFKKFPEKPVMVYWDNRSLQHLKLFYGAIRNAYRNWPESQDFQPDSEEELRAWLTCQAGKKWRTTVKTRIPDGVSMSEAYNLIRSHMMLTGFHSFTTCGPDHVETVAPVSVAFESMSQEAFQDFTTHLDLVLIDVTNCSLDDFKNGVIYAA